MWRPPSDLSWVANMNFWDTLFQTSVIYARTPFSIRFFLKDNILQPFGILHFLDKPCMQQLFDFCLCCILSHWGMISFLLLYWLCSHRWATDGLILEISLGLQTKIIKLPDKHFTNFSLFFWLQVCPNAEFRGGRNPIESTQSDRFGSVFLFF